MAFNNNFIDELKSRINIVDVIGRDVNLKQAGSNYKGLCPFHNEKTPSFVVNEQKQIFNCFGCGEKGDVIHFVQRINNLSFMEACEKLAEEYNVEIPKRGVQRVDFTRFYEINAMAARFFFQNLTMSPNPGYTYISRRGISDATIKHFGIGYAKDSWDSLYKHLHSKGVKDDEMLKLGLINKGKKGYYDKFRKRVIFPIFNTQGKVIGFGGRALGDEMPKYLNSAESDVFQKKNNLYALNFTKKSISDNNQVLIVEGYMDVISLYQSGITNVAASLGTALTDNQSRLVTRYTKNIVLSYDSDSAGVKAALRGIDIMRNVSNNVKVLQIEGGKDPDEFVKKYGSLEFQKLIEKATPATDFILESLKKGFDLTDDLQVVLYIRACVPELKKLGAVERDLYIRKLASSSGISEHAILNEVESEKNGFNQNAQNLRRISYNDKNKTKTTNLERLEISILYILTRDSSYLDKFDKDEISFDTKLGAEFYRAVLEVLQIKDKKIYSVDMNEVFERLDTEAEMQLKNILNSIRIGADEKAYYDECLNKYNNMRYSEQILELQDAIAVAEKLGNEDEISRIAMKLQELETKRRKVR